MAFNTRVFCREVALPSLSELLVWLRQHATPVTIVGGASRDDLLSSFWQEAELARDGDDEATRITIRCLRHDARGYERFQAELADFDVDVRDLPPSSGRDRVLAQLAATRALVIVEFPEADISHSALEVNGWALNLFAMRAAGMVQTDGSGFFDEDDDLILALG